MKRHRMAGTILLTVLAIALAATLASCEGSTGGDPKLIDLELGMDLPAGFVFVGSKAFSAGATNNSVVKTWKYQAIPTTPGKPGAKTEWTDLTVADGKALVSGLAQGEWTIKIEGYNEAGVRILYGDLKKYLTNADKAITVKVNIPTDEAAKGNISATIKWDKNISSQSKLTVATRWQNPGNQHILGGANGASMEEWTTAAEATVTEGAEADADDTGTWGLTGINSGSYMVQFLLYDGAVNTNNKVAGRVAVARVFDGSDTVDNDVRLYAGQFIDMDLTIDDLTNQPAQGYIEGAKDVGQVINVTKGTEKTFKWIQVEGTSTVPTTWDWYVDGVFIQSTSTATFTWATPVGSGTAYLDCIAYNENPGSMGGCTAELFIK